MSEENVEIVRRGYDAFDRRDLEALGEIISDDFELDISSHPIPDFPNTGVGRDHLFRFFATYLSGFSEYEITVTELLQADDVVVALLHDKAKLGDATVERDRRTSGPSTAAGWSDFRRSPRTRRPSKPPGCRSRRCRRRTSLP